MISNSSWVQIDHSLGKLKNIVILKRKVEWDMVVDGT